MVDEDSLRDRLVTAGAELLEQVGAANLGLRAIARRAGVSHGAPRRYFPTHAALLSAVAARGFADLLASFSSCAHDTPRVRIERMSTEYVSFAVERPEMFTLMFRHDLLEGSGQNLRQQTVPIYREWAELVDRCCPGDTSRALGLWTSVHGIAVLAANRSLELIAPEAQPRALVLGSVARHLGPAS
ncbi:TetR/AcrR family transcriptional regulator [Nocardia sp. NPDC003979]